MGIVVATWVVAGLLVAGYIWFMVWRIRVDRRKKAEKEAASPEAVTAAKLDRILQNDQRPPAAPATPVGPAVVAQPAAEPAADSGAPEIEPAVAAAMAATDRPPPAPAPTAAAPASNGIGAAVDVTSCLAGIRLPNDLVPLITMAPRPGVDDRVAFWTDAGTADEVGAGFAGELERLGYQVNWVEERMLTADRDSNRLFTIVHGAADKASIEDKQAFPSVPEGAVVVEVWRQP